MEKILVLLKRASEYGIKGLPKSGLFNSANFLIEGLKNAGYNAHIELCVDANEIDKYLTFHKPTICIIEAIWVTPDKFRELHILHPDVKFVVRVHSKTPFIAMEGIAIQWLIEYNYINNIHVSFNNADTSMDLEEVIPNLYLPNFYKEVHEKFNIFTYVKNWVKSMFSPIKLGDIVNIGCFGAIRPLKNQLNQAVAAMKFADKYQLKLQFYVNATRTEQGGENVLKNLRALFSKSHHELVEVNWKSHKDFLDLLDQMDICLQVSFTESFNIVTADAINRKIPVVVSKDIDWVSDQSKADCNNTDDIVSKIEIALESKSLLTKLNRKYLEEYNNHARRQWILTLFKLKTSYVR